VRFNFSNILFYCFAEKYSNIQQINVFSKLECLTRRSKGAKISLTQTKKKRFCVISYMRFAHDVELFAHARFGCHRYEFFFFKYKNSRRSIFI
jgi:HKD family nuclease